MSFLVFKLLFTTALLFLGAEAGIEDVLNKTEEFYQTPLHRGLSTTEKYNGYGSNSDSSSGGSTASSEHQMINQCTWEICDDLVASSGFYGKSIESNVLKWNDQESEHETMFDGNMSITRTFGHDAKSKRIIQDLNPPMFYPAQNLHFSVDVGSPICFGSYIEKENTKTRHYKVFTCMKDKAGNYEFKPFSVAGMFGIGKSTRGNYSLLEITFPLLDIKCSRRFKKDVDKADPSHNQNQLKDNYPLDYFIFQYCSDENKSLE